MTFGEKLQYLRKTKGLSQEQLASQITVSRQAVSKWELDATMPDVENILQISKLFCVTTDYLLYDSDNDPAIDNEEVKVEVILENEPVKRKISKVKISKVKMSFIVLSIYMITFAIAIMTQPIYLPFFAMIATAISIVVTILITTERKSC